MESHVAGVEGIEPSSKVLETSVLPLNHTPRWRYESEEIVLFPRS